MVILTPQLAGVTMIAALLGLVVGWGVQAVMIYLNFKQAKVKDQMKDLLPVMKDIRSSLNNVESLLKKKVKK